MTVCIASLLGNCSFHSAGTSNYLLEELKCASSSLGYIKTIKIMCHSCSTLCSTNYSLQYDKCLIFIFIYLFIFLNLVAEYDKNKKFGSKLRLIEHKVCIHIQTNLENSAHIAKITYRRGP